MCYRLIELPEKAGTVAIVNMAKTKRNPAFDAWKAEQDSEWQSMDEKTLCEGIAPDFGWE